MNMRIGKLPFPFWGSIIILFGLILGACTPQNATPQSTTAANRDPQEERVISASAEVVPERWVQLAFLSGGVVKEVSVKHGSKVKAGDRLISLHDTSLRAALEQARAAKKNAQLTLENLKNQPTADAVAAAEANLANAKANQDRVERSGARAIEIDAAKAAVRSAQLSLDKLLAGPSIDQINLAEASLLAADAALAQAEEAFNQAELRAPFDGEVVEIKLRAGETASPGMVAIVMANLSAFQIETTDLSEIDVTRIQVGSPASITLDAITNLTLQGSVVEIALRANPGANVTYKVVIDINNTPQTLRWGMTAFVKIDAK